MLRTANCIAFFIFVITASAASQDMSLLIPAAGNSWVHATAGSAKVGANGWEHWDDASDTWSIYVRLQQTGTLRLRARLNVPAGESLLSFSIDGISKECRVAGTADAIHPVGEWMVKHPGYVKIEARGLRRQGALYAQLSMLEISGNSVDSNAVFVRNNDNNYFYWGRRGPSVHINYDSTQTGKEAAWFYSEITVPPGSDVIGSYFMANGFAEGYFGMQVNSATERRIIFSVWSPFKTDDPTAVPADKRIMLIKKGSAVVAEDFGNEGSGGHSHLVYNWKAGQPCRFLLHGQPSENNNTIFTAYFFDDASNGWRLIASFKRPATHTWLRRLHSFLENFSPEAGDSTRKAYYHDQWVKPAAGDWQPLTRMYLTADATAAKKFRTDYDGGIENGWFFLRNGGFFNETGILKKPFVLPATHPPPSINLAALDQ